MRYKARYNGEMSLKLVSLNVQKKEHTRGVARFLSQQNAEVVVLLEVAQDQLDLLLPDYPYRVFKPNFKLVEDESLIGVVLAAKNGIEEQAGFYCDGGEDDSVPYEALGAHRPVVVGGKVGGIQLCATHFTWTPEMSVTNQQTKNLDFLFERLTRKELVLCGDFNIPRGNANYQKLAAKYLDNIPVNVKSTIDWELHRAKREGKEKFEAVVDYVFSTPEYRVSDVRVISGVSDHCALVCEMFRMIS